MKSFLLSGIVLWLAAICEPGRLLTQESERAVPSGTDNNFFEIQKAFHRYWEPYKAENGYYIVNGKKNKVPGWKLYKRWEHYWQIRIDQTTGEFPKTSAAAEIMKYSANLGDKESSGGNWTSMGPYSSAGGYAGTGRINCIGFHPSDPNTFWAGSPSGGLWKTINGGVSWTALTDRNPVLGVSDIGVPHDYHLTSTLYIATGDKDMGSLLKLAGGQSHDNESIGVLKSTDGGLSWFPTGLNFTPDLHQTVSRILVHPKNSSTLWAATSMGIFRTNDGGISWTLQIEGAFMDMEFRPGHFSTLYASTVNLSGTPEIHKTTDGGATWNRLPAGFTSDDYRVDIAVTPVNPDYLYAISCNQTSGLGRIIRSTNSGSSFNQMFTGGTDKALLGSYSNGAGINRGQGIYDLAIAVSPLRANILYIGGINTHKSVSSGTSWECVNCYTADPVYNITGEPVVHADKHMLAFQPVTGALFEANDGGIYKSTDGGQSWIDLTGNLVISQIYRIACAQISADEIIGGLQDNGTKIYSGGSWTDVLGADGMECIIDYSDTNIQYGSWYYGYLFRTTNHWNNYTMITPTSAGYGNWVTPVVMDPVNPSVLYAGYADLWKTTDRGTNWNKISSFNIPDKLCAIAVSPSDPRVIYIASRQQLWMTNNGGEIWHEITGDLPTTTNAITGLAVKHDDRNTVWVTLGGYDGQRIYESRDGGIPWINISDGLPNLPVMCILQNRQNPDETELYAGTDIGVFRKTGSSSWKPFNTGLPNAIVTDLDIYYDDADPENSRLRAATYGRGLWETPLTAVSGVFAQGSVTSRKDITTEHSLDIPQSFSLGSNYPNPFNPSTTILYDLPKSTNLRIEIFNIHGQFVRTLVNGYSTAGRHYVVWNGSNDRGEAVSSGIYIYRIQAGEFVKARKMMLLK